MRRVAPAGKKLVKDMKNHLKDLRVLPPTIDHAKVIKKLSLDFEIEQKDISIVTVQGEKYFKLIRRGVNKTCDGAIQYLEGNYSVGTGERIIIKKAKLSDQGMRFLIPYFDAARYPIYANTQDSVYIRNHYIFLNAGLSDLLSKHLQPDEYEFKGIELTIKKQKSALPFLQPLFESEVFKTCVVEAENQVVLNFDSNVDENGMVYKSYKDLSTLFEALSTKEHPIVWSRLPLSALVERFNYLLPQADRNVLSMFGEDTGLKGLVGPVIKITKSSVTVQVLNTHLHLIEKYQFIDDDKTNAIYILPDVARVMFDKVKIGGYEESFIKFLEAQRELVIKANKTELLMVRYLKKHIIFQYREKGEEVFLGAFVGSTIMADSIDQTISMCYRLAKLMMLLNSYKPYVSCAVDGGDLVVKVKSSMLLENLFKTLQNIGAKANVTQANVTTYALSVYTMMAVDETYLPVVKMEMDMLHALLALKDRIEAVLCEALKLNKFKIEFEGSNFVIHMPTVETACIARPFLNKIAANAKEGDALAYVADISAVERFMFGDKTPVVDAVASRKKMVSLYHVVSKLYGEQFVSMVKHTTTDEAFYELGFDKLQAIRLDLEEELRKQKQKMEDEYDAMRRAVALTQKSNDDDRPIRPILRKATTNNSASVVKALTTAKNKPAASTSKSKNKHPVVVSRSNHAAIDKEKHYSRQQNLRQPEERFAEVTDEASYYDFKLSIHQVAEEAAKPSQSPMCLFTKDDLAAFNLKIRKTVNSIQFSAKLFMAEYAEICDIQDLDVNTANYESLMQNGKPHLCLSLVLLKEKIQTLGSLYQEVKQKKMEGEFIEPVLTLLRRSEESMENDTLARLYELSEMADKLLDEKALALMSKQ